MNHFLPASELPTSSCCTVCCDVEEGGAEDVVTVGGDRRREVGRLTTLLTQGYRGPAVDGRRGATLFVVPTELDFVLFLMHVECIS